MAKEHALATFIGILAGAITYFFGGRTLAMETLITLMIIDYISGVLAAMYLKELSSEIGFKGILKKVMMFFICAVSYRFDVLIHANSALFTAIVVFYCCNEALSIIENAIRLDLPIPEKLKAAIQSLKEE